MKMISQVTGIGLRSLVIVSFISVTTVSLGPRAKCCGMCGGACTDGEEMAGHVHPSQHLPHSILLSLIDGCVPCDMEIDKGDGGRVFAIHSEAQREPERSGMDTLTSLLEAEKEEQRPSLVAGLVSAPLALGLPRQGTPLFILHSSPLC